MGAERQTIRGTADHIARLGPIQYRPHFATNDSNNVNATEN